MQDKTMGHVPTLEHALIVLASHLNGIRTSKLYEGDASTCTFGAGFSIDFNLSLGPYGEGCPSVDVYVSISSSRSSSRDSDPWGDGAQVSLKHNDEWIHCDNRVKGMMEYVKMVTPVIAWVAKNQ